MRARSSCRSSFPLFTCWAMLFNTFSPERTRKRYWLACGNICARRGVFSLAHAIPRHKISFKPAMQNHSSTRCLMADAIGSLSSKSTTPSRKFSTTPSMNTGWVQKVSTPAYFCARIILTAHFSYSFQQLTISKVLSYLFCSSRRSMQPPHPTAGRLHLDPLWWTAGAETSAREIDRRASSSALVSSAKPTTGIQVVRPAAPLPRLAHSRCPQGRAAPPQATPVRLVAFESLACARGRYPPLADFACAKQELTLLSFLTPRLSERPTIFHAVTGTVNRNDLRMLQEPVEQGGGENLVSQ